MRILFLLFTLLFSVNSFAKEYDCKTEAEKIVSRLQEVPDCFKDEECRYFDYGYPFQPDACSKAVVSTEAEGRNITNLRLIDDYLKNCVENNEQEKKKFEEFENRLNAQDCPRPSRLFCLKGKCRTQGYVMFDQPDAVIRVRNKDGQADDATDEDIMKMKGMTPINSQESEKK